MAGTIAEHIDGLLAADKRLLGKPDWVEGPREDQLRWSAPLAIDDETIGMKIIIDAYPHFPNGQKFSIHLTCPTAIWRVECTEYASHVNTNPCPEGVIPGLLRGPHHHSWPDNRHLATQQSPPNQLKFARPLAANIQGLENTIRWFCDETKIVIDFEIPNLPKASRLI